MKAKTEKGFPANRKGMGYESFCQNNKADLQSGSNPSVRRKTSATCLCCTIPLSIRNSEKECRRSKAGKRKTGKLRQKKLISESFEKPMRLKTGIISCESMKNMTAVVSPLILLMIMAYLPF
ncbi:type IV secretion system protein PtlF domain protein (plasmid) [Escherichia coli]|nr:type IV secretion system protein PtlF domain protein [Escherichia coli]